MYNVWKFLCVGTWVFMFIKFCKLDKPTMAAGTIDNGDQGSN